MGKYFALSTVVILLIGYVIGVKYPGLGSRIGLG